MRTSDGATHIHGDDLGSATNTTGPNAATQRYFPWGAKRSTTELPTPYRFTGQREESKIGLYFYNARWYDPALGRFIQPDTLVPEPGNPQALNRYAYTLNNPVRYRDPTGRFTEKELVDWGAYTYAQLERLWQTNPDWYRLLLVAQLGDSVRSFSDGTATFGFGRFARDNEGKLILTGQMMLGQERLSGPFTLDVWGQQFGGASHQLVRYTQLGQTTLDSRDISETVAEMTPGYIHAPLVPVPRPGERKTSLEKSFAVAFLLEAGGGLELVGTEIVHASASFPPGWPRAGGLALGYTIKGFGFWVWALAYNQALIPIEPR